MQRILAGMLAALMLTATAQADDTDGTITAIDPGAMTITLDDGKSYKLPDEFNLEGFEEGMEVIVAFEEIGGIRQITDMAVYE